MTDMASEDVREVEFIYPLERIALISSKLVGHKLPLLNGFKEFYDLLEIKQFDVSSFKKNNFNKGGSQNKFKNQSNSWRRKNKFRAKDIEKFLTNTYIKQLPQNDEAKIRKTIISHLNKLNEKKFTIIVKEFIDHLEEQMFSETFDILNFEILNKVFHDNNYVYLYAKLVKELIVNKKWQRKMFNIITGEDGEKQYYWTLNSFSGSHEENEYVGPFSTESEALDDAIEHHNFKSSFCFFLQKTFEDRDKFQEEIRSTRELFDLNIFAKNKYMNFLKLVVSSVEQGIFSVPILHHCLLKLLETREMEQFALTYEMVHNNQRLKISVDSHNFYESKLNEIITTISITPKTKFKLQEFFKFKQTKNTNQFEALAVISSEENTTTSSPVHRGEDVRNMECIISEFPISQDYEAVKELFSSLSSESYKEFNKKIMDAILETKESESQKLCELVKSLWSDFQLFSDSYAIFIKDNMINLYAEYEIDYPNCKTIFLGLIKEWLEKSSYDKEKFVQELKDKNVDDEDEQYNIDLFNEKVVSNL